jgi:Ca2+-binding RTX toxin-like protein
MLRQLSAPALRHKGVKTSSALALAALAAPLLALVGPPSAGALAAAPTCQGKGATIEGTSGADLLVGTDGRDVIVARAGDDKVVGLRGNDLICGGPGSDELMGGSGDDRLFGQGDKRWADRLGRKIVTGDVLHGGRGDDLLHPGAQTHGGDIYEPDLVVYHRSPRAVRVDLSTGPATGRAVARGEGVDRIVWRPRIGVVGSRWDDRLVGSDQRDYLVGVEGDDTLEGGRANDRLYPDRASSAPGDAFPSSGGNDVVVGGRGNDLLKTFEGRDNVRGGAGEDVISVQGGVGDVVAGGKGADLLVAYFTGTARGLDRIELDGGADPGQRDVVRLVGRGLTKGTVVTLDARSGTVVTKAGGPDRAGTVEGFDEYRFDGRVLWRFVGTQGRDQVGVASGRLRAWGAGGPDILQGGPEPDRMSGGAGDDYLGGGDSGDILRGDSGRDHLVGHAGIDTCLTGERVTGCERK